ncbi:hemin uptake protein HemP [Algihabitans sp.]|uniref:hemin uptake protein HemP n=1 Tax=Algihabitans sp. TaxID=2821514 RepID=UPI003BA9BB00
MSRDEEQTGSGRTVERGATLRIDSANLLAGAREILIEHKGETYRLRCTSNGKLILTK